MSEQDERERNFLLLNIYATDAELRDAGPAGMVMVVLIVAAVVVAWLFG